MNNLEDLYVKGDISPRISNSVLKVILETPLIKNSSHRIASYCFLGVYSYLKINNKYDKFLISGFDIKKFIGYSEISKKIDYLIKDKGVLNELGFIESEKNPFEDSGKNGKIKIAHILDEMEDCHTFNLKLFFECMKSEKLNLGSFFVANYLKEFDMEFKYGEWGSLRFISNLLKIPKSTVSLYLNSLYDENIIEKENVSLKENTHEMTVWLRGKLNDWKRDSLNFHSNKCFVSGLTDNLDVHHLIPFNSIRNYIFEKLEISYKPINEYTVEELSVIEKHLLDYHKLTIGVPLTKEVHKKFHMEYGYFATLENLLDFKDK